MRVSHLHAQSLPLDAPDEAIDARKVVAHPASQASALPLFALTSAPLLSVSDDGASATVRIGPEEHTVTVDPSVHVQVLRTALRSAERVIVQRDIGGLSLVGALRTAPTPGVDEGEDYHIQAKRVVIEGEYEVSLKSGKTGVFVRAMGQIESLAETITARASSVHKIIGRIIRLN